MGSLHESPPSHSTLLSMFTKSMSRTLKPDYLWRKSLPTEISQVVEHNFFSFHPNVNNLFDF